MYLSLSFADRTVAVMADKINLTLWHYTAYECTKGYSVGLKLFIWDPEQFWMAKFLNFISFPSKPFYVIKHYNTRSK